MAYVRVTPHNTDDDSGDLAGQGALGSGSSANGVSDDSVYISGYADSVGDKDYALLQLSSDGYYSIRLTPSFPYNVSVSTDIAVTAIYDNSTRQYVTGGVVTTNSYGETVTKYLLSTTDQYYVEVKDVGALSLWNTGNPASYDVQLVAMGSGGGSINMRED